MNHRGTEGTEAEGREEEFELSGSIIGAAIEVHRHLGPGLLESAYEQALCHELQLRGLRFVRQLALPVTDKGIQLDCGFRADIIVAGKVILELKAAEALLPVHEAQLLTYLKMTKLKLGLLINFNVSALRSGIRRLRND